MTFETWFNAPEQEHYQHIPNGKSLMKKAWEACKQEAIKHTVSETEKWDSQKLLQQFVTNLETNL